MSKNVILDSTLTASDSQVDLKMLLMVMGILWPESVAYRVMRLSMVIGSCLWFEA
jgi:hypothetical protein